MDYATNIGVSDRVPVGYVGGYREKLGEEGYKKVCEQNALPENFETMEYLELLKKRRQLMAQVVRKAYRALYF